LSDRIVQRSLLNLMFCEEPSLKAELGEIPGVLRTPTSFAGVPGKGVPEAIDMAANATAAVRRLGRATRLQLRQYDRHMHRLLPRLLLRPRPRRCVTRLLLRKGPPHSSRNAGDHKDKVVGGCWVRGQLILERPESHTKQ
jgi:hypothetical protein